MAGNWRFCGNYSLSYDNQELVESMSMPSIAVGKRAYIRGK
jgi:hypothetical protein